MSKETQNRKRSCLEETFSKIVNERDEHFKKTLTVTSVSRFRACSKKEHV